MVCVVTVPCMGRQRNDAILQLDAAVENIPNRPGSDAFQDSIGYLLFSGHRPQPEGPDEL